MVNGRRNELVKNRMDQLKRPATGHEGLNNSVQFPLQRGAKPGTAPHKLRDARIGQDLNLEKSKELQELQKAGDAGEIPETPEDQAILDQLVESLPVEAKQLVAEHHCNLTRLKDAISEIISQDDEWIDEHYGISRSLEAIAESNASLVELASELTQTLGEERQRYNELEKTYSVLRANLDAIEYDRWGSLTNLQESIRDLEDQIRQIEPDRRFEVPQNFMQVNKFQRFIALKFLRQEELLVLIKKESAKKVISDALARCLKEFGSIDEVLKAHDTLKAENQRLRMRELRFSIDPLLKRVDFSSCSHEYLQFLCIALQNELGACRAIANQVTQENHPLHSLVKAAEFLPPSDSVDITELYEKMNLEGISGDLDPQKLDVAKVFKKLAQTKYDTLNKLKSEIARFHIFLGGDEKLGVLYQILNELENEKNEEVRCCAVVDGLNEHLTEEREKAMKLATLLAHIVNTVPDISEKIYSVSEAIPLVASNVLLDFYSRSSVAALRQAVNNNQNDVNAAETPEAPPSPPNSEQPETSSTYEGKYNWKIDPLSSRNDFIQEDTEELLSRNEDLLKEIYFTYSEGGILSSARISYNTEAKMTLDEFALMCKEFNIMPDLVSKRNIIEIFRIGNLLGRFADDDVTTFSFDEFKEAIARVALVCYHGEGYNEHYPTQLSRVQLFMNVLITTKQDIKYREDRANLRAGILQEFQEDPDFSPPETALQVLKSARSICETPGRSEHPLASGASTSQVKTSENAELTHKNEDVDCTKSFYVEISDETPSNEKTKSSAPQKKRSPRPTTEPGSHASASTSSPRSVVSKPLQKNVVVPKQTTISKGVRIKETVSQVPSHIAKTPAQTQQKPSVNSTSDSPLSAVISEECLNLIDHHIKQVRQIYLHYRKRNVAMGTTLTFEELDMCNQTMNAAEFNTFCKEFKIVPDIVSKRAAARIFRTSSTGSQRDDSIQELSFPEFKEALCKLAIAAYISSGETQQQQIVRFLDYLDLRELDEFELRDKLHALSTDVGFDARKTGDTSAKQSTVKRTTTAIPLAEIQFDIQEAIEQNNIDSRLQKAFLFYCKSINLKQESFDDSGKKSNALSLGELNLFCRDFELTPRMLKRTDVAALFNQCNRQGINSDDDTKRFSYPEFTEFLVRASLHIQECKHEQYESQSKVFLNFLDEIGVTGNSLSEFRWKLKGQSSKADLAQPQPASRPSTASHPRSRRLQRRATTVSLQALQLIAINNSILKLLKDHDALLKEIFDFYAKSQVLGVGHRDFNEIQHDMTTMNQAELLKFFRDFHVMPRLISQEQAGLLFLASNVGPYRDKSSASFNYEEFKDCILRLAIVAFSKSSDDSEYPDNESKVQALLDHLDLSSQSRSYREKMKGMRESSGPMSRTRSKAESKREEEYKKVFQPSVLEMLEAHSEFFSTIYKTYGRGQKMIWRVFQAIMKDYKIIPALTTAMDLRTFLQTSTMSDCSVFSEQEFKEALVWTAQLCCKSTEPSDAFQNFLNHVQEQEAYFQSGKAVRHI